MAMWDSFPAKNFILPYIHIQIGIRNYVLINLIDLSDSYAEKLSTGEEVAWNTLVMVHQVIAKIRQDREIWDGNDGVMLQ